MTDPGMADRTYVGPMTPELVEQILEAERPDAILPTMGGQTGLNLAKELSEVGGVFGWVFGGVLCWVCVCVRMLCCVLRDVFFEHTNTPLCSPPNQPPSHTTHTQHPHKQTKITPHLAVGHPRQVRRRAHRRQAAQHRPRRGPRALQAGDGAHRPQGESVLRVLWAIVCVCGSPSAPGELTLGPKHPPTPPQPTPTPPLKVPMSGTANNIDEALAIAAQIGRLPLIIRPAFTCGGMGGGIAYNMEEFKQIVRLVFVLFWFWFFFLCVGDFFAWRLRHTTKHPTKTLKQNNPKTKKPTTTKTKKNYSKTKRSRRASTRR